MESHSTFWFPPLHPTTFLGDTKNSKQRRCLGNRLDIQCFFTAILWGAQVQARHSKEGNLSSGWVPVLRRMGNKWYQYWEGWEQRTSGTWYRIGVHSTKGHVCFAYPHNHWRVIFLSNPIGIKQIISFRGSRLTLSNHRFLWSEVAGAPQVRLPLYIFRGRDWKLPKARPTERRPRNQ